MKKKRTIVTVGLDKKEITSLKGHLQLLKNNLADSWVFFEDETLCDVVFVSTKATYEADKQSKKVVINVGKEESNNQHHHFIAMPYNSIEILTTLNTISRAFPQEERHKSASNRKSLVASLTYFFSKKHRLRLQQKSTTEQQTTVSTPITEKLLALSNPNKNKQLKVSFLGPPGSGKTTILRSTHSKHLSTSEVIATDSISLLKEETTIGIEYCICNLANDVQLKLFGTPGQERYHYLQKQTLSRSDLIVILIDASRENPINDFLHYKGIIESSKNSANATVVVAFTHAENNQREVKAMSNFIKQELKDEVLAMSIDPRNAEHARSFLQSIADHRLKKLVTQ